MYPKRRQKSPNPTLADPYSLLKSVLAEKKRTRMGSRTVLIIAMTLTRREKSENENGFRRFWRAKTPEKAFSGNYTFSASESAQVPVLQGERAETKRGLTAIAIRPRDKLGGGASGIRTRDPYVANVMLYQLSYSPVLKNEA